MDDYSKTISNFLQHEYSDERLAMLLAHAESGKLAYYSCCCLIGIPNADHALRSDMGQFALGLALTHYGRVRLGAQRHRYVPAEQAFKAIAHTDEDRRRAIIPLIKAEMARREAVQQEKAEPVLQKVGS